MAARRDSTDLLASMNFPVLVIAATEDSLTPVAEVTALHKAIRGSRLCVIEGAGHLSNLEQPRQFNSALIDFVQSLGESG
jgi:pimeloyl-ACP methyl ester carboxylesterase